jgi:hypothetical protein
MLGMLGAKSYPVKTVDIWGNGVARAVQKRSNIDYGLATSACYNLGSPAFKPRQSSDLL